MGATSEEEEPALPRNGILSQAEAEATCKCFCGIMCFVGFLGLVVYGIVLCVNTAEYSMEIAAVSGLDPYTDLQGSGVLSPEFNVTVRIGSKSRNEACLAPDTSVEVSYSYLNVPLAAGRVPAFCARPRQVQEQTAVARGRAVVVLGFLLDSLAEDMRTRQAVFTVRLMNRHLDHWDEKLSCWGLVGAPCVKSATAGMPPKAQAATRGFGSLEYVVHRNNAAQ